MSSFRWFTSLLLRSRGPIGLAIAVALISGCASTGTIRGKLRVPGPTSGSDVSDAVIFAVPEKPGRAKDVKSQSRMRLTGRGFEPRILAVPQGTAVDFHNTDNVFHNVFSLSSAKQFDLGRYAPGEGGIVIFNTPGVVNLFCEFHAESAGFIVVLPDALYARPDAAGDFTLPKLRKGRYTVTAWHPLYGEKSRSVDLPSKGEVDLQFEF